MHQVRTAELIARPQAWGRNSLALAVVACLLTLAAINISLRASWHEVEAGVLWPAGAEGVVAAEIAGGGAAEKAGLRVGDVLIALNGNAVDRPDQVLEAMHAGRRGDRLTYTVLRQGART